MMADYLSSRLRKAAALGLLLIAVLLVWLGAVTPVVRFMDDYRSSFRQSAAILARYEALIDARPGLEAQLKSLEEEGASGRFYETGSPELATAAMQTEMKALVRQFGGQVDGTQSIPPRADGPLTRIGVRMHLSVSVSGLHKMLAAVESGPRLLLFDEVAMRTSERQEAETEPMLAIDWAIYGYNREGGP